MREFCCFIISCSMPQTLPIPTTLCGHLHSKMTCMQRLKICVQAMLKRGGSFCVHVAYKSFCVQSTKNEMSQELLLYGTLCTDKWHKGQKMTCTYKIWHIQKSGNDLDVERVIRDGLLQYCMLYDLQVCTQYYSCISAKMDLRNDMSRRSAYAKVACMVRLRVRATQIIISSLILLIINLSGKKLQWAILNAVALYQNNQQR